MAFQQTTASSLDDVISQICAFAVANAGFTDNGTTTVSGYTVRRISKGGIYWSFRPDQSNIGAAGISLYHIFCRMSYNITSGATPTSGNGQREWTAMSCWNFPGPYPTLYLFTEGNAVHAVLELTTRVFNHISFGKIIKTDTFTGGEYICANFCNYRSSNLYQFDNSYTYTFNCGDGDAVGTNTGSPNTNAGYAQYLRSVKTTGQTGYEPDFCEYGYYRNNQAVIGSGIGGICARLFDDTPNVATMRSVLLPQYVFVRNDSTGLKRISGYIPDVRLVPMTYLDPGEIILNDWQVFPFIAKESNNSNYPGSGKYGLAYKRTP